MTTWQTIDSRRAMTATDATQHTHLVDATVALERFAIAYPALMHLLRDHQSSGVRAAALDNDGGGAAPWCWRHEQSVHRCWIDDYECDGEVIAGPSDPTGTAATAPDRAAADARKVRRLIESTVNNVAALAAIATQYPAQATTPADVEAQPGDDWCVSCWRDAHYCEPIATHADGRGVHYRGLCRWCAEYKQAHGQTPPLLIIQARHRGERITQGMIDKAKRKAS